MKHQTFINVIPKADSLYQAYFKNQDWKCKKKNTVRATAVLRYGLIYIIYATSCQKIKWDKCHSLNYYSCAIVADKSKYLLILELALCINK